MKDIPDCTDTHPQDHTDDLDARLAGLRDMHVVTVRDTAFAGHLDRLLTRGPDGAPRPVTVTRTGETRGVLVVGAPGSGKTEMVGRALDKHPRLQPAQAGGRPHHLSVRVESPATVKSLGLQILQQTGYDVAHGRMVASRIWTLVRHRLALLGIAVLWIDEAHDLFQGGSAFEVQNNLKFLKSLMQGEAAVVLVLSGTDRLGRIAQVDAQVSRRLSRMVMPAVSEATDGAMLGRILARYCDAAGLAPPAEPDLVPRLVHAGRGQFGRCLTAMLDAIERALRAGHDRLDIQHFAESFGHAEGCLPGGNVFLAPNWRGLDLDADPDAAAPQARPRAKRRARG